MPNPADGNTIARFIPSDEIIVSFEVLNSQGIYVQGVLGKPVLHEIQIETQNLAPGIYWVRAVSKGIADVQKLVIAH
ncbi:MAG: T9SS type A sorting domain-containing protein [Bdellovibrionales bacterium]